MTAEQERFMARYQQLQNEIATKRSELDNLRSEGQDTKWLRDQIASLESEAHTNYELATDRGY